MGIFGGEKYSKEGYEKAKEQEEGAYNAAEHLYSLSARYPEFSKVCNELIALSCKASEKAEELYGKGQAEAIALNEEYSRLLSQVQEAIKAVADFEREKLGMHKEGAEEADANKE